MGTHGARAVAEPGAEVGSAFLCGVEEDHYIHSLSTSGEAIALTPGSGSLRRIQDHV